MDTPSRNCRNRLKFCIFNLFIMNTSCLLAYAEVTFLTVPYQGRSYWGNQGAMASPLQFPNQIRSKSFSFKHQGYCLLRMFRNYVDKKFDSFYCACYNFWSIYGGFSFFLTT